MALNAPVRARRPMRAGTNGEKGSNVRSRGAGFSGVLAPKVTAYDSGGFLSSLAYCRSIKK